MVGDMLLFLVIVLHLHVQCNAKLYPLEYRHNFILTQSIKIQVQNKNKQEGLHCLVLNDLNCNFFFLSLLDSFVNSQEWTLSRSVPELKVVSS